MRFGNYVRLPWRSTWLILLSVQFGQLSFASLLSPLWESAHSLIWIFRTDLRMVIPTLIEESIWISLPCADSGRKTQMGKSNLAKIYFFKIQYIFLVWHDFLDFIDAVVGYSHMISGQCLEVHQFLHNLFPFPRFPLHCSAISLFHENKLNIITGKCLCISQVV